MKLIKVHLVAEMDFLESSLRYETSRIRTDVPYLTAYIRIYSSRGPCIPRTLAAVLPEAHFKQLYLDYVESCETDEQDTEQRVVNRIQKKLSAQGLSQYQWGPAELVKIPCRPICFRTGSSTPQC